MARAYCSPRHTSSVSRSRRAIVLHAGSATVIATAITAMRTRSATMTKPRSPLFATAGTIGLRQWDIDLAAGLRRAAIGATRRDNHRLRATGHVGRGGRVPAGRERCRRRAVAEVPVEPLCRAADHRRLSEDAVDPLLTEAQR